MWQQVVLVYRLNDEAIMEIVLVLLRSYQTMLEGYRVLSLRQSRIIQCYRDSSICSSSYGVRDTINAYH